MLELAIRSRIPVIVTTTTDTLNVETVLRHYAGEALTPWLLPIREDRVYWMIGLPERLEGVYGKLVNANSCLVLVNPGEGVAVGFDAGPLVTPKGLVLSLLQEIVGDAIPAYANAVSGLTIKQAGELVRLTQVQYGLLDPHQMTKMRSLLMAKTQGLAQVSLAMDFYQPDSQLDNWVKTHSSWFLNPPDPRLTPRGLLLDGEPGVGKTQGAKYLALSLGVPLYRLDLSTGLGRYVGESEGNMSRALTAVEQEAPCVFLIDEVEKLFGQSDDSGVTARLLAHLLWWLQERQSRVLTVMTTNDFDALPKELYRSGRVDKVITLNPLGLCEAYEFAEHVLLHYQPDGSSYEKVRSAVASLFKKVSGSRTHAELVELVKEQIRFDKQIVPE